MRSAPDFIASPARKSLKRITASRPDTPSLPMMIYNRLMNNALTITIREVNSNEYAKLLIVLQGAQPKPVSFLQAPLYGRLQAADGKTVVYFAATAKDKPIMCGLAIRFAAPGGLKFLYCPYGPIATTWTPQIIDALRAFLKPVAKRLDCTFVRLDNDDLPALTAVQPITDALARTASLQPRAEWVLDITPDVETLWMALHKHARYNVRLSERADARIQQFAPLQAPLDDFFSLMQTTGKRDGFGIFDRSYYHAYLQSLPKDEGFVTICYLNDRPAAAALCVTHDQQAHYVFAGSSNDFRKIAPAYSVVWSAIAESKSRGCTLFNFGGITDTVKGHGLQGVTSFKKRFGGYRIEHANPVDLAYKPLYYTAFRLYKTFRS